MQSADPGTDVREEFFNTEFLALGEQGPEELDRKIEEIQKGMEDDILEFAKKMDVVEST